MEVGAVREGLDLRVHDIVALDEIELYAEVLSAVAATETEAELMNQRPMGFWVSVKIWV